jgi:uncharacterized delta-60 repeat protein
LKGFNSSFRGFFMSRMHAFLMATTVALATAVTAPSIYAAGGDLDASFGTNGSVVSEPGVHSLYVYGTSKDSQGRVLLAASGWVPVGRKTVSSMIALRYLPNGSLDTSFGTGGKAIAPIPGGIAGGQAMQALEDPLTKKVFMVGTALSSKGQGASGLVVARFNVDGTLDTTFSRSGLISVPHEVTPYVQSALMDAQGRLVIGAAARGLLLLRLNGNGSLDTSFAQGGKFVSPSTVTVDSGYTGIKSMSFDSQGRIVAAVGRLKSGYNGIWESLVYRFTANGNLDTSFNGTGYASINNEDARAIEVDPTGKIWVTTHEGIYWWSNSNRFNLARFNSNGTPDTSFGTNGILALGDSQSAGAHGRPQHSLWFDSEGRALLGVGAVGDIITGSLIRVLPSGVLDSSYGSGGTVATNSFTMVVDSSNRTIELGIQGEYTAYKTVFTRRLP